MERRAPLLLKYSESDEDIGPFIQISSPTSTLLFENSESDEGMESSASGRSAPRR